MVEEKIKINELEKVVSIGSLLDYMSKNCNNYNKMIEKYNDISISVNARREDLGPSRRVLESVSIMKEYLKDTNKQVHVVVNEYYKE